MIRRLIEMLIIEAFERHKLDHKIKNASTGDFFFLKDLVDCTPSVPISVGHVASLQLE